MKVIVPSRGRPLNIGQLIESFDATRIVAELHVVVDEDDPVVHEYDKILAHSPDWVRWTRTKPKGMVGALNEAATKYANVMRGAPKIIGFMGDDHRPRTYGWDVMLEKALERIGIAYGNDLLQGANLPTQVFMSSEIIRALGHMAPPFRHLYVDNYWRALGEGANCLSYLPDVIIEHMHPVAGKAEWDDRYKAVNAGEIYQADAQAFASYLEDGKLAEDIRKVGNIVGMEALRG